MTKFRRILRYAMRQWRWLLLIVGLSCAMAGAAALGPWPIKLLADCALGSEPAPSGVRTILGWAGLDGSTAGLIAFAAVASLLIFLLNSLLDAGLSLGWSAAGQRMVYDLAGDLFARLSRLSLLFHGRTSVGDSLSRLSGDTWCVYTVTEGILVAPIQNVLTLALVGTVAWRLDWQLALVSLAAAPALGASAFFFGRALRRQMRINREAQARMTSFVHNTLGAIPLVQTFGAESRNVEHFRRLANEAVDSSRGGIVLKQIYSVVNTAATAAGIALVLYFGGRRVMSGAMSLGSLLVFLAYLKTLQGATQGLLGVYGSVKSVEPSIDRVLELLDSKEAVSDPADAVKLDRSGSVDSTVKGRRVAWENVSFGYEAGTEVLHEITLAIEPGQMLAIVGPTGAGKSTMAALVPRLIDPWAGRLTIDAVDARKLRLAELREQVSVVLQEPFLLPLSVAENIAYGRPGATRAEIENAARAANAEEFIRALPRGYDTVIGERGATLSGGQRQRLAIARALLKNAPILILDEPTAALDAQTEEQVMGAIGRLMRGRTCIVIAHRLSTVRKADRIAVLEAGRIVQCGTHEELVRQEGLYQRLCAVQFGKAEGVLA